MSVVTKVLIALRILDPDEEDKKQEEIASAPKDRKRFILGTTSSPVVGVLILLASKSMDGATVRKGIAGADGVEPFDIS